MFASSNKDSEKESGVGITLASIKHDIEVSYKYFQPNYKRYHEFYDFVFRTAISAADIEKLKDLGKPPIESPLLEAYLSRLRGEFAKQSPNIDVHPAEGLMLNKLSPQYLQTLKMLQAHLNEILLESSNDEFEYDMYSDILAGGFGVARVFPDYVNDKSMMQKLNIERCFNPTMCGFDPLARKSHKGDGRYCFELSPMTKEEFAAEYGKDKAKEFYYTRAIQSFNWSYQNNEEKIVLVGDYYVKKPKNVTLCLLADNQVTTETDYNKMVREWASFEQPPVIVQRRKSIITTIERYRICENEILEEVKTDYPMLPLVFFDGNSVMIQNEQGGQMQQFTKPFVYNARGAQQLKNFAMQNLGSELEDILQQQWMVPLEAIPQDPKYREAFIRPQVAATLAYHQFDQERPDIRLDPPQVIQRRAIPPQINEVFVGMDGAVQASMGTYDAIMGINGKDISGKAIQQGALQSNAAAMPYLVGFMKGLQRCAEIIVHMIPLYYKTPRTVPIRLSDGKRDYITVNDEQDPESFNFNYDPHELNVSVQPGVNNNIQKQVALEQLTQMMQASPIFAEFMNRKGLPVLLDNMDIRGIEGLKEKADEFNEEMQKEREAQAGQPTDTDKIVQAEIEKTRMETEVGHERVQNDAAIGAAKIATEREKVENDRLEIELKAQEMAAKLNMEQQKIASEDAREAIRGAIEIARDLNSST